MKNCKTNNLTQRLINYLVLGNHISKECLNDVNLLKKASENRVLYEFCRKIKKENFSKQAIINSIIRNGDNYLLKLRNTLLFIKKEFKDISYLVVKTNRIRSYITYDVDVLVSEKNFIEINSRLKLIARKHFQGETRKQINISKDNLLKIDLHQGFYWQGSEYLDLQELWSQTQEVIISGTKVQTPSREMEVLINLAHFLTERRYLTLLEFWYFKDEFIKGLDLIFMYSQAKKYNWKKGYEIGLAVLETINREFFKEKKVFSENVLKRKRVDLPFFLTTIEVIEIFLEKSLAEKKFPVFDFLYYILTLFRYNFSNKKIFPYYQEWFGFNEK